MSSTPLRIARLQSRWRNTLLLTVPTLLGVLVTAHCTMTPNAYAQESATARIQRGMPVWPGLAPGETSSATGTLQPFRPQEEPPVSRVTDIRKPTIDVFLPQSPSGVGVLVLPGGGFGKVVPDKEGSETAPWLNDLGIAVFVLRYRTNETTPQSEPAWRRPLQDAQRALRLIRSRAKAWQIDPDRLGVLGFSAGGQVASILHTRGEQADYDAADDVDRQSPSPRFSLLVYPWRVLNANGALLEDIKVTAKTPPAFLVHTHDDASSSLGSVLIYAAMKCHGVDAELHVYRNGGHGYGMRPVSGSNIGSWPNRATDWLAGMKLAPAASKSRE